MPKLPASKGGKPGPSGCVTPASSSKQVVRRILVLPVGNFTQNTSTAFSRGPLGFRAKLEAAYLSFRTLPAGGTLSNKIGIYDASANAAVDLTATLDPEALTAREGAAFTLAGTNPSVIEADDTIEVYSTADNNAVGTQQVDGYVTLVLIPAEDTPNANGQVATGAD